jgi:hypothetical protein
MSVSNPYASFLNPRSRPLPGQSVCIYVRVSTPKQKLEHQVEAVKCWLEREGISVPKENWFQDKEKRHKSDKRDGFQRLLAKVDRGEVEWVVVAAFDRWGVADSDEFMRIRSYMQGYRNNLEKKPTGPNVGLYSINDDLDLARCQDHEARQVFSLAAAATMNMGFYAERNIMKMKSMAKGGWHASKEHPFGMDLLCCRLSDKLPLFRVHLLSKSLERSGPRVYRITHYNDKGKVTSVETATKMPPRDCKSNGYRLTPSEDQERIETVKLIFELADQGLWFRQIARHLHAMGKTYFGKVFGENCLLSILRNPAYLAFPAWGKTATGTYRQLYDDMSTKPKARKPNEPLSVLKGKQHFAFAEQAVFDPETFVKKEVFERVQKRLDAGTEHKGRGKKGQPRPRRASKAIHPLNGLLACPDCGERMVVNYGTRRTGERVSYFVCGDYNRSKIKCRPNSVRFTKVDEAAEKCFANVEEQLRGVAELGDDVTPANLLTQEVGNFKLMGKTFCAMAESLGIEELDFPVNPFTCSADEFEENKKEISGVYLSVYRKYLKANSGQKKDSSKKVAQIDKEILKLGKLMRNTESETLLSVWAKEVAELEAQKKQLTQDSVNLFDQLGALLTHRKAIWQGMTEAKRTKAGDFWSAFVDEVIPVMEEVECNPKRKRNKLKSKRICTGFDFYPKSSVNDVLPSVLEIRDTPRDRD